MVESRNEDNHFLNAADEDDEHICLNFSFWKSTDKANRMQNLPRRHHR